MLLLDLIALIICGEVCKLAFENMTEFIYLGLTVTCQNHIHKEIKCHLNSGYV